MQELRSSTATASSQIETLKNRIESLEASNRDALSVLDAKNRTIQELSEELGKQHQKNVELNKEIAALQQSTLAAQSAASSAKFREQALKQELELVRRNEEFARNELTAKTAEATRFRKEKGARIAELQRQLDDAHTEIDSLKRNEQQLRSTLEETQRKAEQTLLKVQQLENAAADATESFRRELEGQKRLVQMKDEHMATHLNRVKELEARLERVQDDSEREVRRVRQELEQEKSQHEDALQRINDLDRENSELRARVGSGDIAPGSAPQTPRQSNGSFLSRALSPFPTPGSVRAKSLTTTQIMDELYKTKAQVIDERKKNEILSSQLDEAVSSLEAVEPELTELRSENQRLIAETAEMSHMAEESYKERDLARRAQKKAEAALKTSAAEVEILQLQIRDLGVQIQMLLFNQKARESGLEDLTPEEAAHFERLQRGEIAEDSLDDLSDTHQLISRRFVVFKDIQQLQKRNEELLKAIRELADRWESDEAVRSRQQAAQNREEVDQLRTKVATLTEELKSVSVQMKTYMSERDIFRRMLQNKASAAEINSTLGLSMDGNREVLASIEQGSAHGDEQDYATLLRELQSNFDAYRAEQATDRATMRDQINQLSNEKGELQAKVAKAESQLSLANERYSLLAANLEGAQRENKELQKRALQLSESAARQDVKTQQVTEELVEKNALLESLRSENSNLKAEKALWRSIQERLNQDNESLVQEKANLGSQLATLQAIANQKDIAAEESARRLRDRINELEADISAANRKLADEIEEGKKLQLRHHYDVAQSQKRIDDLVAQLSNVREELVAAKSARDHLQIQVDELSIKLRSAEERTRLQPRPTPRPMAPAGDTTQAAALEEAEARISELENTVADLQRDLKISQQHLENAQAQVTRYRELSEAFESDLVSLRETHEQYEAEMTSTIDSKDAVIRELRQRIEDMSTELATSNNQLSSLRDSQADITRRYEEEKGILDSEIQRLKDNIEQLSEARALHNQDMRAQTEIAAKAQQAYEVELVRHAEAAKAVQALRNEHNQLKTDAARWKADAEAAKVMLAQNEHSWEERRQMFEKEISELKSRRDDINAQNKLLHQQLDSVTSQIAALQTSRATMADEPSGAPASVADSVTEGLRELNSYLRREKEILEVQYDLQSQEVKRLQSSLKYTQQQLEDERLKLEQERRENADSSRSSLAHKDLMEKLNELNVYRESSTTLRNEARQAEAKVAEKEAKIQELEAKLLPMESRIEELLSQKAFLEEDMKQLQDDRDRWQKRTESILSKYDRVDPAEMEQLKQSLADVKQERDNLQQALNEKTEELEQEKINWRTSREKLVGQAKEKARQQNERIQDLANQKTEVQQQLDASRSSLASAEQKLEAAIREKQTLDDQVKSYKQQLDNANRQLQANAAAAAAAAAAPPPAAGAAEAEKQLAAVRQELAAVRQQLEAANAAKGAYETELAKLRADLQAAYEARDQALAAAAAATASGEALQNGLGHAQAENVTPNAALVAREAELQSQLAAAQAKAAEMQAKVTELEQSADQIVKERSEKMKAALNNRLREAREKHEHDLQELRKKMDEDFKLKLEQERVIWLSENAPGGPAPSSAQIKQGDGQQEPGTPATPTAATASADLSKLTDAQIRDFLANNPTVKSIVANNIKKRIDVESKKVREEVEQRVKDEYDAKIAAAREQAILMESKKATLRISMADNKLRQANAKIQVVETAAKETPERPVGEVWEIAKNAKPPPPTTAQAGPPQRVSSPAAGMLLSPVSGAEVHDHVTNGIQALLQRAHQRLSRRQQRRPRHQQRRRQPRCQILLPLLRLVPHLRQTPSQFSSLRRRQRRQRQRQQERRSYLFHHHNRKLSSSNSNHGPESRYLRGAVLRGPAAEPGVAESTRHLGAVVPWLLGAEVVRLVVDTRVARVVVAVSTRRPKPSIQATSGLEATRRLVQGPRG